MKVDFDKTLRQAEIDELDLEYVAKNHNYSKYAERFDVGFQIWFDYIETSTLLQQGGFPFDRNDFKEYEWKAMGIISGYNKAKQNGD